MKHAYLIHGWGGSPTNSWFPWLQENLKKLGYLVSVPDMPDTDSPKINPWVDTLKKIIKNENTILIGHSIGCQAILRYLQGQEDKFKAVFLVAGFVHLNHLETKEEKEIAKPWLTSHLNWNKLRNLSKYITFFSDNDSDVDLSDSKIFQEKLGARVIIEHDKGHFDDSANIKKIPSLLREIKNLD